MSNIMNHVAILASHALAAQVPNELKGGKMEYYAVIAFPPSAGPDIMALMQAVATGGDISKYEHSVKQNQHTKKPIVGIPGDWLIVRAATQFPPYVADVAGNQLNQADPAGQGAIRAQFYAGKKIRAAINAFTWNFKGKDGISFNVDGVMDAGEAGERLNIGQGAVVNAFAAYANPNAQPAPTPGANAATASAPAAQGNPFGAQPAANAATTAGAAGANPFAQAAPANANPFAQSA